MAGRRQGSLSNCSLDRTEHVHDHFASSGFAIASRCTSSVRQSQRTHLPPCCRKKCILRHHSDLFTKSCHLMKQEDAHWPPLPQCSLLSTAPSLAEVRERIIYSRRLERLWAFVEERYADPDIRLTDAARHSGASPRPAEPPQRDSHEGYRPGEEKKR